jgi:hypothetical protein
MAKMLIMVFQVIVLWDVNVSEDVLITADISSCICLQCTVNYWLLLWAGILQSIPCTAAIFQLIVCPYLNSNYPDLSTSALCLQQGHLVVKQSL